MGTTTQYARRMARPPWSPDDSQKKLIAAVKRAARKRADAEAEYKEALAAAAAADVPIARLAEELDVERKTVYRHLGRSMT